MWIIQLLSETESKPRLITTAPGQITRLSPYHFVCKGMPAEKWYKDSLALSLSRVFHTLYFPVSPMRKIFKTNPIDFLHSLHLLKTQCYRLHRSIRTVLWCLEARGPLPPQITAQIPIPRSCFLGGFFFFNSLFTPFVKFDVSDVAPLPSHDELCVRCRSAAAQCWSLSPRGTDRRHRSSQQLP